MTALKFQLCQIRLETLGGRYFLPLPKLTDEQLEVLAVHLGERGFSLVRRVNGRGSGRPSGRRRIALKNAKGQSIAVDQVGLAWSNLDMLDQVGPAMPRLLECGRETTLTNPYFTSRSVHGRFEVRFSPRLESMRSWTALRKERKCGLTPDERLVLEEVFSGVPESASIDCVTNVPFEGSSMMRVGRQQYFGSNIPLDEFLRSLATLGSRKGARESYLLRDSTMRLDTEPGRMISTDLGEWCYLEFEGK